MPIFELELSNDQVARLDAACRELGKTRQELLQEAIARYLARLEGEEVERFLEGPEDTSYEPGFSDDAAQ